MCGPTASMMPAGQSSTGEASRRMNTFLGPKTVIRIGYWNVRTMAQTTKTAQVVKEMERYRLSILGISEMRWPGSDQKMVNKKTIIHSGTDNGHHK